MQRKSLIMFLSLVLGLVGSVEYSVYAEQPVPDTTRWDLVMIKEAPIWKNLLKNYGYAEHKKYWPERKAALETIVNQVSDSRWADDALLILACGKAGFENDTVGAIADLRNVVKEYPKAQTIVVYWDPDIGCVFDQTWLMWRGGLVFLNPDKTIRIAKPFDRDDEISQMENEALAYFGHLEKYPRSTKVMARLFMAEILARKKGDVQGAIAVLEEITADAAGYLAATVQADGIAALKPDGYHIRTLYRPELGAYFSLIGRYEELGKIDKAIAKADEFAGIANKAPRWDIIKRLGEFYNRHNLKGKAAAQYRLALTKVKEYIEADRERSKRLEHIKPEKTEVSANLKREEVELENLIKKRTN